MRRIGAMALVAVLSLAWLGGATPAAAAKSAAAGRDSGIGALKHIIVIFQENRAFDHYFGALTYAPGSPYHRPAKGACASGDHACVDGLSCKLTPDGALSMPAFGRAYSDDEVAAVANYVTARFGAKGANLTVSDVAKLREQVSQ